MNEDAYWRASPLAVASNLHHVYTVSLVLQDNSTEASSSHNNDYHYLGYPTTDFKKGFSYYETTADDKALVKVLGQRKWETMIAPNDSVSIASVAGMLLLGDVLLVAGSTTGQGLAVGRNGPPASGQNTDDIDNGMDGIVTKLVRNTGELYNETATDNLSSYRVQSQRAQTRRERRSEQRRLGCLGRIDLCKHLCRSFLCCICACLSLMRQKNANQDGADKTLAIMRLYMQILLIVVPSSLWNQSITMQMITSGIASTGTSRDNQRSFRFDHPEKASNRNRNQDAFDDFGLGVSDDGERAGAERHDS